MKRAFVSFLAVLICLSFLPGCPKKVEVYKGSGSNINVLPGVGAAGIRLRMSEVEVLKVMGEPEEFSPFPEHNCFYYNYKSKGISILFKPDRVTTIFLYSGLVGGYEKGDYSPYMGKTAKGIYVGSKYVDVLNTYGGPLKQGKLSSAPVPSHWINYQGIGFSFIISTDQMVYMKIF